MNDLVRDALFIIVLVSISIRWWYIAKESSRKYILSLGLSILTFGIFRLIGLSYDITVFMIAAIVAFFSAVFFCIRAILSERHVKKQTSDE